MSIASELGDLKKNSTATAEELRQFMGEMQGKNPQEVMGLVASSGLASSILVSTAGCVVLMFMLTVIPYFWEDVFGASSDSTATAVATPTKSEPAAPAEQTQPSENAPANVVENTSNGETPSTSDVEKAAAAMGIDETKTAKPNENPLDKVDSLLEGID
ncbi:MAG: hypothetical protein CMJ78_08770 [Planctomycetaceae bacterium]|nr:hypothetical protein [Planctomycetaceae bacterium]